MSGPLQDLAVYLAALRRVEVVPPGSYVTSSPIGPKRLRRGWHREAVGDTWFEEIVRDENARGVEAGDALRAFELAHRETAFGLHRIGEEIRARYALDADTLVTAARVFGLELPLAPKGP